MQSRSAPVLILLVAMASIQLGASLAKQVFPILGPIGTTMARISIAAMILFAIWRPNLRNFGWHSLAAIALYGAALGLMNLCFYLALNHIPLGIAVALEFTGPLTLAFFASRRPRDLIWVALSLLGILLLIPIQTEIDHLDLVGVLFALAAGFFWALYIIFGRHVGNTEHGGHATALGMLVAALVVLPFALASAPTIHLTSHTLLLAAGVAVLSSALPYSLEMIALKQLPIKTFGILMSLEPAIAASMGFVFLGELLSGKQWLAIFCVITASAGSTAASTSAIEITDERTLNDKSQPSL